MDYLIPAKTRLSLKEMRALYVALAFVASYQAYHQWRHRSHRQPPGILVREEPQQIDLPESTPPIVHGEFNLKPLARYKIKARLLAREGYNFDWGAKLSPVDLCVGWGKMSNTVTLDELSIDQDNRFCNYHWDVAPPLPEDVLNRSMANIHIVPADRMVELAIEAFRPGQIIEIEGQLVSAHSPDGGGGWTSSLSREDRGGGACELMYVTKARVVK